jgi:hypothetical protein
MAQATSMEFASIANTNLNLCRIALGAWATGRALPDTRDR